MNTDPLRAAFLVQAEACANLDSPFMAQLCTLFAKRLEPGTALSDRLFNWPGDVTPAGASVPLRLAGALHALCLNGHVGLKVVYPPNKAEDEVLWSAVSAAMNSEAAFINSWIDSPPQTNEVRRSAVLIAVGQYLAKMFQLPFVISELGASAGLNLKWEQFALVAGDNTYSPKNPALTLTPEWRGSLPPKCHTFVAERRGVDLSPISTRTEEGKLRLLAYLWPDQPERITLTKAAINASAVAAVDKGDAIDWLQRRLRPKPQHLHLIFHTVAWQYFSLEVQERGLEMIEAAGEQATPEAPLAWFAMENGGDGEGAALTLRLWPGNRSFTLGRACFHGRWVDWKLIETTSAR